MPSRHSEGPPSGNPEHNRRASAAVNAAAGVLAFNVIGYAPNPPTSTAEFVVRGLFAAVSTVVAGVAGYSIAGRAR